LPGLHQPCPPTIGDNGEFGCWVDHRRRADEKHAVGEARLSPARRQRVRRYRLAEHDGIALEDALALGTAGRDFVAGQLREGVAGVAAHAAQLQAVAVDLGDGDAPGLLMEVVDVLGDDVLKLPHLLQLREGVVGGVGPRLLQPLHQLRLFALSHETFRPPGTGVGHELLVAVHGGLAVLGPEAAGAAKGRDAALDGDAGAHQGHRVLGGEDDLGGVFQGLLDGIIARELLIGYGHLKPP
jgi:hypothetical protein